MRVIAHIFSYLFHPIFLIVYLFLILFAVNPYIFGFNGTLGLGLYIIYLVLLSIFFPLLCLLLMRFLGLVDDFKLEDKKERIGPMIATSIFYIWLFLNIYSNPGIPAIFSSFVLGSTIALFGSFFINNFTKISLHSVAMGGFLIIMILIRLYFSYENFPLQIGDTTYIIHMNIVLLISLIIVGIVCSSRLILGVHNLSDVKNGFLIGAFAQLIAFKIMI